MYVPADEAGLAKLKTEWLAARVVFAAGFVISIAFAAYWSYSHRPSLPGDDQLAAASDIDTGQMDDAISSGQTSKEGFALCRLAIGTGEAFGVVPNTMRYVAGPGKTDVQGRYACAAQDKASVRYTMILDLVCKDLNNPTCINLVTITKADGTVVFKRQDNDQAATTAPAEAPAAPAEATTPATDAPPATDGTTMDATGNGTTIDGSAPPPQ